MRRLLGIGGAHVDRRGQVGGDHVPAASNPGTMREEVGGGALNALRSAAQRGVACTLISVRGGDAAGEAVARAVAEAGISDLSVTFLDRATASYTALIDRHGELITGLADMGLYDLAFPKQMRRSSVREAVAQAHAVLCDANVPEAGLTRIAALAAGQPLFAIGVSPAKVTRLAGILPDLTCAFLNRREAATLARHFSEQIPPPLTPPHKGEGDSGTSPPSPPPPWEEGSGVGVIDRLRKAGLRSAVVTAGGEAVVAFDADGVFRLTPPAPRGVADVTGAGDALAGAAIAALLAGRPLGAALREGVAASILAIESPAAVPDLSGPAFEAALRRVPEPQPVE